MPMKPKPGESQSEFTSRCVPDMMGDGKRDQDQAVAICLDIWRNKDKKQYAPDPEPGESHEEFLDRCTTELLDDDEFMDESEAEEACQVAWEERRAEPKRKMENRLRHKTHAETVQGMEFVLSDETIDRMGDSIKSDGWDVTQFKRNPVALFNHNPNHPIGKWSNIRVADGALRGQLVLAPKGTSARIDEIRALVECGVLQAVSVGFRPIEHTPINPKDPWGGSIFTKQELVETSLVSVPANPNALAVAKALNISAETLGVVFAPSKAKRTDPKRRDFTAKHGQTSRVAQTQMQNGKGAAMTLAQRILELQTQIANKQAELEEHLEKLDDSNVSDADLDKTTTLNAQIGQLQKQYDALIESEKRMARTAETADSSGRRSLVVATPRQEQQRAHADPEIAAPIVLKKKNKDWEPMDYYLHAGVAIVYAKIMNMLPEQAMLKLYGDDEPHKVMLDWSIRAASAPAMTTVTGWAAELVQQVYGELLALLMPQSVFPRFSARGLQLSFGRAGKVVIPSRSRTPTIAGSFVGEGMPIPVRQGAFTTQTFIPKKLAVITTFTREMSEHSIPAIEGVLRDAISEDTSVAVDSVLLDANPATTIRPAGLLNGVSATGATAGGGIAAIIGDVKNLINALTTATYGNIRSPVWLMNPAEKLTLAMAMATNAGTFPFRDEVRNGTLATIPIIDSATVPVKEVILADAADFVTIEGGAPMWAVSDQATLHMEDTTPLELVSGSPGTVASPQRSLFQTDSLGLRMIQPLNWGFRRSGMVAWTQNVTWS